MAPLSGRRVTVQVEDAVAAVVEEKESDNVVRRGALCIGKGRAPAPRMGAAASTGMTIDSTKLGLLLIWLMLASGAGSAVAQEVYRTVNADGVVTFSDQASVGAERLVLPSVEGADESALAAQQARIEQQLEVARVLEESRLAREDARIRRLEAQAARQPQTVYYPVAEPRRYVSSLVSYRSVGPYRKKHHRGSWKRDKSWPGGNDGGYGGHDGGYGGHPPAGGPGGGPGPGHSGGSRAHGSSLLAPP